MRHILRLFTLLMVLFSPLAIDALPIHKHKATKRFASEEEATHFYTKYFNYGCAAFAEEKWDWASVNFRKVVDAFPDCPSAAPAFFFYGVSLFNHEDYELANDAFTDYLKLGACSEYFEEAIQYKFQIAEAFRCGYKRRMFKFRCLPKWMCAKELAISIYDEVIMAMPSNPIAAEALFAKGCLLQDTADYRGSIEEFQSYVRRFPKSERTPEAYLMISKSYYLLSKTEFQNPDLLALAAINVRRFEEAFPKEESVVIAQNYICEIEELYAGGLCQMGNFYVRKCKPFAAALYYRSTIVQFPNTPAACYAREQLICLGYDPDQVPDCSESTHIHNELQIEEAPSGIWQDVDSGSGLDEDS